MSQSGPSPHRGRRKDQQPGGGGGRGSASASSSSSSNYSSSKPTDRNSKSSAAQKSNNNNNKGASAMNGSGGSSSSSSPSSSNDGVRIARTPQAYASAVSGFKQQSVVATAHEPQQQQQPSERTHYIAMNLIGQQVRAVHKDGTVYEGLFHRPIFDHGFGVVLNMARKKEGNDFDVIQTPPIECVTIQPQDLVLLDAPEVAFIEDSAEFKKKMMREGGFRTDTEISNQDFSERELVRWTAPEELNSMGGLEDESISGRNHWDQFEANERLFGVRTTYDESFYTTEIDRQRVTREVVEKAIRIERELKYQMSNNPHVAEERGIVAPRDDTEDEEDKYSSVLREIPITTKHGKDEQKGSPKGSVYVVPAKRKTGDKDENLDEKNKKKQEEREKARESELKKLRQHEMEIEREREREKEKEKEREKARQKERERLEKERANKDTSDSPSTSLRSRSTTSLGNLVDEAERTAEKPSPSASRSTEIPTIVSSPFRQRSYSMSNIGAAGALDPDDPQYIEKLRVRQRLLAEARQAVEPRAAPEKLASPFQSPIVGRPDQIKSLDLSPAVPKVSESVLNEFKEYKERKRSISNASSNMPTKVDLANFSKEIEKKASAPNSPALRARRNEQQHQPSPLSPRYVLDATAAKLEQQEMKEEKQVTTSTSVSAGPSGTASVTSTPFATPAVATPANESPASSTVSSGATSPRKTATVATATSAAVTEPKPTAETGNITQTDSGQPQLSKIQLPSMKSKLNPFAKAFTPKARPTTTSATTSETASPLASGASKPDISIPVSSFYAQGMRRLQENPEDPEQVSPLWPNGRMPYRQEDTGIPIEGYPYPPVPAMAALPPQAPRPLGYPVPYVTSPPPLASGQPVMMFPPGQPVHRGFVPQGTIPTGPAVGYYPAGPAGQPFPPHMYTQPAPGPMGHKGRMGPYPPGPHVPHAAPHSPQGTPPRAGPPSGGVPTATGQSIPLAGGPPQGYAAQFPPSSPSAYGVPPEHGASPHSPHGQPASPHSPHAPRVPVSPTQPIFSFSPTPHILGDPLAVPPGRNPHQQISQQQMVVPGMGRGGYRFVHGQGPQGPPQAGRGGPTIAAGAFFSNQRTNQPRGGASGQTQDKEGTSGGGQRFKVPNTDALPAQQQGL